MNEQSPWMHRGLDFGAAHSTHHGGPPALAWATFALVLLLALAFFATAVSQLSARRPRRFAFAGPGRTPDPLAVLQARYARGEIGRDEYLQAVADLTPDRQQAPTPPS
jgi:uncharacterized membrane protein